MKNSLPFLLLLFTLLAGPALAQSQQLLDAVAVGVESGDVVTVKTADGKRLSLQLMGIQAPRPGEPFSNESKASLSKLALGKSVKILSLKSSRNGHTIANVVLWRQASLSFLQLEEGMAWYARSFKTELGEDSTRTAARYEANARRLRKGIWKVGLYENDYRAGLEHELRELTHQWDEAMINRDRHVLEFLMTTSYVAYGKDFTDKRSAIGQAVGDPDLIYKEYEREVDLLRLYGDTGFVYAFTRVSGVRGANAEAFHKDWRSLDVWVLTDGMWQCITSTEGPNAFDVD